MKRKLEKTREQRRAEEREGKKAWKADNGGKKKKAIEEQTCKGLNCFSTWRSPNQVSLAVDLQLSYSKSAGRQKSSYMSHRNHCNHSAWSAMSEVGFAAVAEGSRCKFRSAALEF